MFSARKHMKRHEKPYGCTYQQCPKRFGSKNDWKRHENSQHFQLEVWKCDEKLAENNGEPCGKVCHRRETFKSHILKEHKIEDKKVEDKLERCRIGRNCEARFWCGFCQQIIEIKEKGQSAWTERFNHIDDHYSGRNFPKKKIGEWKSVDPDLPEVDLSPSPEDSAASSPEESQGSVIAPNDRTIGRQEPSDTPGKKRKAGADNTPEPKRRRADASFMWTCVSNSQSC
jgi:sal-like protein